MCLQRLLAVVPYQTTTMDRKRRASLPCVNSNSSAKRPRWCQLPSQVANVVWQKLASMTFQNLTSYDHHTIGLSTSADTSSTDTPPADTPPADTSSARVSLHTHTANGEKGASQTQQAHLMFLSTYNVRIPTLQFVGLCAYLCAILRLRFPADTSDLDVFVCQYPAFEAERASLEHVQAGEEIPRLVSYHQWLRARQWSDHPRNNVLTAHKLREIWAENPYTFLRVYTSFHYIVRQRHFERVEN